MICMAALSTNRKSTVTSVYRGASSCGLHFAPQAGCGCFSIGLYQPARQFLRRCCAYWKPDATPFQFLRVYIYTTRVCAASTFYRNRYPPVNHGIRQRFPVICFSAETGDKEGYVATGRMLANNRRDFLSFSKPCSGLTVCWSLSYLGWPVFQNRSHHC